CVSPKANTEKVNLTPFEWFGNDNQRWAEFEQRVNSLPLSPRKKDILLSKDIDHFPDDPTPLARAGARPRQFMMLIQELFRKYKVEPPTINYELGKPYIQSVGGRLTATLRKSWDFPEKNRWETFHHAQDAVLLTACPPHTWRMTSLVARKMIPAKDGKIWNQGGFAVPELAPDVKSFFAQRKEPIIRILGKYPINWRTKFSQLTFYADPTRTDDAKVIRYKFLKDLSIGETKNIVSETIKHKFIAVAEELFMLSSLPDEEKKKVEKKSIPEDKIKEHFGYQRRVKVSVQKAGVILTVQPQDGPKRKIQIDAASIGAVVWTRMKGKMKSKLVYGISVERPDVVVQFGGLKFDPPIPDDAIEKKRLLRNDCIWLPIQKSHPAGYYRVKEFSDTDIKLLPENALPTELAIRAGLNTKDPDSKQFQERKLGKTDLRLLFPEVNQEQNSN
ncbi:MAG: hypothetical protein QME64_10890, partial [bacterium]|nr:hypothetical protein [bacterium]